MEKRELTVDELNHVSGGTLPCTSGGGIGIDFSVCAGGATVSWKDKDGGTWTIVGGEQGVTYTHS